NWLDQLTRKLGLPSTQPPGLSINVKFVDPVTGASLYELPRSVGHPCMLTRDGKLLAAAANDASVEVWKTTPSPRWPIVVATGVVASLAVMAFGRRLPRKRDGRLKQEPLTREKEQD